MANKPTQTARIGSLSTALGQDKLVLTRFDAVEGLSQLFEYNAEALSDDPDIDFSPAIGEKCCVSLKTYGDTKRHFHGILVASQWTGRLNERYTYRLRMRPWFWLLTRSADCVMYKEKTVPDIITEVFGRHGGYANYEIQVGRSYPVLKYCVQYRETDFNFVSRLMEEFGIYYYFEHGESQHKMVLKDGPSSSHPPKTTGAKLQFRAHGSQLTHYEEHVYSWMPERRFNTGKVILKDYNFHEPGNELLVEQENGGGYQNDKLTVYDYPGRYKDSGKGTDLAKVKLEAEQAQDHRCQASGDAPQCAPGCLVSLAGHPEGSQNKSYLVVQATHTYAAETYRSGGGAGEDFYTGHYEFLSGDVPFRAPQVAPKPKVYGPQTAVVVGEGEIDVDEDGCIMVRFHWDRDKQQSRKVRLAQVWSGKNWGGIYIPRVGMEVVVEFVEGDPDRPLVIGTVYNRENPVPYTLKAEKTVAGVKSKTDGGDGYNEFVFDDKDGDELVRMHAQKDHETKVENDERRDIGRDISKVVGSNETVEIGKVYEMEAGTKGPGKIEFKVGQSKIVMDPMSITIESPMISIKATMTLDAEGNITTVKGNAFLILKGGLITIN